VGLLAGAFVALVSAPLAGAAPIAGGDITVVCAGTTNGTTFTLTANCGDVTSALTVPPTITTVNGAGFTISATDPGPAPATYSGAVLTNAGPGQTMNIENLTVTGPAAGFSFIIPQNTCLTSGGPNGGFPGLFGIFFNDASGSVNNVKVMNIFQTSTGGPPLPGSPACNTGHDIRADGVTAARTVTITNTQVSLYQKAGMFASGSMTMNVDASTIGPPSLIPFSISQNGVQWTNTSTNSVPAVGASGTLTNSTIIGASYSSTRPVNPAASSAAAVLMFGATNVTVDHNTITGGSDIGISVVAATTNATISFNAINRPTPPTPDSFGLGVSVDETSTATLICNTFSGWITNIDPPTLVQQPCPPPPTTTTAPPTTVAPTTAPTTVAPSTVAPTTEPSVAPTMAGTLPPTGSSSSVVMDFSFVLLALGAVAVIITTTRRRARRS
jgi:hypothetical protein